MDKRLSIYGAAGATIVITLLSLLPLGGNLPCQDIVGIDKLVHFTFYLALSSKWMNVDMLYREGAGLRSRALIAILCCAYSVLIEFVQHSTGRYFELADIAANSMGALLALLLFSISRFRGWLRVIFN